MFSKTELSDQELTLIVSMAANYNRTRNNMPKFEWGPYKDKWQNIVSEVEKGYSFTIYEYTNDLSVRGLLDEFLQILPNDLGIKLAMSLKNSDERFRNATNDDSNGFLGISHTDNQWWYRVPKLLVDELKQDIETRSV